MAEVDPGAEAYASPVQGWIASTIPGGLDIRYIATTENNGGSGPYPDLTNFLDGGREALRTDAPLTGTFAAGNWTFHCAVRANTAGSTHDGRVAVRLVRSKVPGLYSGSFTEITSARTVGTSVTNLTSAATQTSTVTLALPAFSLDDEYLFLMMAWNIQGAGSTLNDDVNIRLGTTATRLISTDFTASASTGASWYLTNAIAAASSHQQLSETSPGAAAFANPATGWVVGTTAASYAEFRTNTEQATSAFSATVRPDGVINAAGDCWRTLERYTGVFAAGTWAVRVVVRPQTGSSGVGRGRPRAALFRGVNADGSDAVLMGAAANPANDTCAPTVGVDSECVFLFAVPETTCLNEFIFIQLAWQITTASGGATDDVNLRIGTEQSRVTAPALDTARFIYDWIKGTLPGWLF
jgi:hypothetical protein